MSIYSDRIQKELDRVIASFEEYLGTLRTGRANIKQFENIPVEYYGVNTPLKGAATITIGDNSSMVFIIPFARNDKSVIDNIVAGIQNAQLGYSPIADAGQIKVTIPALTAEKRKEIVNQMYSKQEHDFKKAIRQIRQEFMHKADNEQNVSEDIISANKKDIDKLVKAAMDKLDSLAASREQEITDINS